MALSKDKCLDQHAWDEAANYFRSVLHPEEWNAYGTAQTIIGHAYPVETPCDVLSASSPIVDYACRLLAVVIVVGLAMLWFSIHHVLKRIRPVIGHRIRDV